MAKGVDATGTTAEVMNHPTVVLLPGLDGTGELFGPLLGVIPEGWPRQVVVYPVDRVLSYSELGRVLEEQPPAEGEVVLVAESFSGPVAVRYAAAHPGRVRAVVLCASFVRRPVGRWARWVVWPVWFRVRMPQVFVRWLMVGWDAQDSLVQRVRDVVGSVAPEVLAARVREVLEVDCRDDLRRCAAPMLYLAASRDAIVGRWCVEVIREVRPDVEVRVVEGPHLVLQRAPEVAWREIVEFLERGR